MEINILTMPARNPFVRAREFASLTTDTKAMKIFLAIAKNRVETLDNLIEETEIDPKEISRLLERLEEGGFIRRNPLPSSKKFRLAFNGQLFAEQLKIVYPEIRRFLGEESLIEKLSE